MNSNPSPDNSLRKVAILVASLDEDWGNRVLASLLPSQARQVRQLVSQLGEIDPEEQNTIVTEFRHTLAQPAKPAVKGVELDASLVDRIDRNDYPQFLPERKPGLLALSEADSDFIVEMLRHEHPQTIALVVSRLESQQGADVLGHFSQELQADIVLRLADLDSIDAQAVEIVEKQVAQWIDQQRQRKQRMAAGMELVEKILGRTPHDQREALVARFQQTHPDLAGRLSPRRSVAEPAKKVSPAALGHSSQRAIYSRPAELRIPPVHRTEPLPQRPANRFAHLSSAECLTALERLDRTMLQTVLSRCEARQVNLALAGASDKLLNRVLSGVSRREAQLFRRSLREQGPIRLDDILSAQQQLLQTAAELL